MPRIKILPENIANMIAAGEVIERPASIVKELVENSLDARADQIEIHIKGYGRDEISVIDNGHGMSYHDALLAFERHATSKIQGSEDLYKIRTLGFRGEALPSIASVSKVILTSREREAEIGTQVIIDGGKLLKVSEVGAPVGTSVRVLSLFKNIPARRKFMKGNAVELNHITQTLYQAACSFYQYSFTFYHQQKVVWHMQKAKTLKERIQQIYGHEILDQLLEVDEDFGPFKISGYIGSPTYSKANRFSQYIFINQRFVRNPTLMKAVSEGYSQVMPQGRYPLCFLFLTIPTEKVDVNVHPAKIEVRFSNQQEIFLHIVTLLKNRLATPHTIPRISSIFPGKNTQSNRLNEYREPILYPESDEALREIQDAQEKDTQETPFPHEGHLPFGQTFQSSRTVIESCQGSQSPFPVVKSPFQKVTQNEDTEQFFTSLSDFLQIEESFILFENRGGLVIVDQHAAHERIQYERIRGEYQADSHLAAQRLLIPIPFQVPGHLLEFAEELLSPLHTAGFEVEHFGHNTFVIKAIPLLLRKDNPKDLIQSILDDLSELPGKDSPQETINTVLMRMACSSAIKANQKLTTEEMKALIEQLKKVSMPFRCPHGRPTVIQLPLTTLLKYFLRT